MNSRSRPLMLSLLWLWLAAGYASAAVFIQDRGAWPQDWPQELEPLRDSSRTVGIGTAIQQNIYEIPIPDQETFEKVWPAVLKLRTPGSPIALDRVGSPPPKMWGDLLSNERPAIRIYAPTDSYASVEPVDAQGRIDYENLVREGRALRAGPPWPEYLVGEDGGLPEYVVLKKNDEGELVWVPADPFAKEGDRPAGFFQRARTEIELVIDGQTIDLNRVPLPDGAPIIDRRFDER